jgi:hypothetical protein
LICTLGTATIGSLGGVGPLAAIHHVNPPIAMRFNKSKFCTEKDEKAAPDRS